MKEVEHRTFSAEQSLKNEQTVMYITERCVFHLTKDGVVLTEIAPGINLEKDILSQMDFAPIVANELKIMDERIFIDEPMGLRAQLLDIPFEDRFTYDPLKNIFFVNLEGFRVRTYADIQNISHAVERHLSGLTHKVPAIVNYDRFDITPELFDAYADMVKNLADRFYSLVTRYTASTFLRAKLNEALKMHSVDPQLYETLTDARKRLDAQDGEGS